MARVLAPVPWDVEVFASRIGAHRGRPLIVRAVDIASPEFNGLVTSMGDVDVIAYKAGVSPRQRDAIICHEIGHLLLDHPAQGQTAVPTTVVSDTFPSALAERFLLRSVYDDEREAEAELFATRVTALAFATAIRQADRLTSRLR